MKRGLDWYKREPQAFLDGVQGMGPELIGAYAVLLDLIYARGGETRRDDHHLAGVMGCSKRKATSLTDQLIERKKIIVEGDFITNSVAKNTAKSRRNLSEVRAEAGRAGGIQSGVSRKNNELHEANASSKTQAEKRREEEPPFIPPEGDDDDLFSEQKPKTSTRGTRLPEDWALSKTLGEWAVEEGLSPPEVRREAEKFKDYFLAAPGAKGRKVDWSRTFKNWIRTAVERRQSKSFTDRSGASSANPILAELRRREAQGGQR